MFFQESEAIATENLDLRKTVERVDHLLATIFNSAPLRPEDFAWKLDLDVNQVIVVFEILTSCGVLLAESVVECRQCQNLVPVPALEQAEAQKQAIECFGCGCSIEYSSPVVTVYRMTAETLARPKPSVATANVESALRELDQYPNVFRRLGHCWVIKYDSKMVLLHSPSGLSYIARLLVDPARKIPAAFLLAAEMGIDPRIPVGSSGPILDARRRAPSPHHLALTPPPSPSSPLPPSQNLPRSPAGNSAGRSLVNCQTKSRRHAVGTRVGALFACWPASNGTIVANPRRRRGARVVSFHFVGWRSSTPSPCWLRRGTGEPRPHSRSCLQRSRTLRPRSVAAQERLGNYESRDLRGDRPSAPGYSFDSFPNRCLPLVAIASQRILESA